MAYNASSVVDFLTSRGIKPQAGEKLPLFDLRSKLYGTSGLQLGDYRGTQDQNTALLNYLSQSERNAGVSINSENLYNVLNLKQADTTATDIVDGTTDGTDTTDKTGSDITEDTTGGGMEGLELPPDVLEALYGKNLSSDELAQKALEKFTSDTSYGLKQEESESDKAALQLQAQADKESFIKKIASQGLIFSGAKKTGLASIDADAIAKQFGIDRKFALYVAQGLESAAQDIAKEASKGNSDALASLRSLGYDVNPLTGRIEQTQTAKNASATQARFEETQKRLETNTAETQRIAQERLDITKANAQKGDVVSWSQWAAERGLVGAPVEQAQQVALKEAQDEKKQNTERELSSVRSNIFDYIRKTKAKEKGLPTREELLEQLISSHKLLTKEQVATELYGLTKVLEK
jgi:stress response protein YsnF